MADKYIVKQRFMDAAEYVKPGKHPKDYEAGDDVSSFDKNRLEALVKRGLVVLKKEEKTNKDDKK